MDLVLHTLSGSPYGWRVQLALAHKGLAHRLVFQSLSARDLDQPAYRALNPRGRVPTLVRDGAPLYESIAILAWLDAAFPERPILGRGPDETGLVWRLIAEYTCYLDAAVEAFILPLYFGTADADAAQVAAAIPVIDRELATYEAQLDGRDFLAGDDVTAADFVLLPALQSLRRAGGKDAAKAFDLDFLRPERFPRLDAWRRRMEARPGYEATIPPHWRG